MEEVFDHAVLPAMYKNVSPVCQILSSDIKDDRSMIRQRKIEISAYQWNAVQVADEPDGRILEVFRSSIVNKFNLFK